MKEQRPTLGSTVSNSWVHEMLQHEICGERECCNVCSIHAPNAVRCYYRSDCLFYNDTVEVVILQIASTIFMSTRRQEVLVDCNDLRLGYEEYMEACKKFTDHESIKLEFQHVRFLHYVLRRILHQVLVMKGVITVANEIESDEE